MNRWISQLLANLGHQDLNLFAAPTKNTVKHRGSVRLDSLHLLDALEPANFFESVVLGPGADGDLIIRLAWDISRN